MPKFFQVASSVHVFRLKFYVSHLPIASAGLQAGQRYKKCIDQSGKIDKKRYGDDVAVQSCVLP
jgi:hypothetical protein